MDLVYIISVSDGLSREIVVYIETGNSKVIYDCGETAIQIENENDVSQYISV